MGTKSRVLITLAMFYLTISLACDPLAFKVISLPFSPLVGSALLFPLLYASMDIIAELYGEKTSRYIIYVHIVFDCLFTFTIIGIAHLPSPSWWTHQEAYNTVLNPMGRLYVAGIIGSLVSSLIDVHLLVKWRDLYQGKYFWARSVISSSISILAYTVVTNTIAFIHLKHFGAITLTNIVSNIVFAAIYLTFSVPLVRFLKHILNQSSINKNNVNNTNHSV